MSVSIKEIRVRPGSQGSTSPRAGGGGRTSLGSSGRTSGSGWKPARWASWSTASPSSQRWRVMPEENVLPGAFGLAWATATS